MLPLRLRLAAAVCMLAVAVVPWLAVAGTTGKVSGRVVDPAGKPLLAVNVILVGARLGAVSDESGEFSILNVPPGTYDLKASLIGRQSMTLTGLVVSADRTSKADLTLREQAVGLEEIVVTAKRPVVESDLTSTRFIVRAEEIAKLPVQDLQELVNLQAGVVDGHVRGGRTGEVQYQVNGVSVNNLYDNSAGIKLDRSLLQEVQVISGTFDAEYGQALSGVVNAVLKSGSDRFEWNAELYAGDYLFDGGRETAPGHVPGDRLVSDSFRPISTHNMQASVSGPSGLSQTTFLVSGRWFVNRDYLRGSRYFLPTDQNDFQNQILHPNGDGLTQSLGYSKEWSGLAKLTNKHWSSVTMSYEALFNAIEGRRGGHEGGGTFRWRYNPDGMKTQHTLNLVHGFDWTQRLSKNSFYNLTWRQNRVDYTDWAYEDVFDPRYDAAGAPQSDPSFENDAYIQGVDLGRFEQNTDAWIAKASATSQIHRYHLVKVGGEIQRPRVRFGAPGTLTFGTVDGREQMIRHIDEPPDYPGVYTYNPVLASAFAQDQVEWRDLTVRAGLRFEFFDARSTIPSDLANPANSIQGAPQSVPKATTNRMSFSPRVGISYPVGARAAVFFSYGHFYQLPGLGQIFGNADYSILENLQAGDVRFGVLGNPDIKPERTVQYEFGYKHAITSDLGLDFTAFYKDIRDLLGVEFVDTYAASEYARLTNVDFGNVLGLTLALDQRAVGPLSATMDYTWQVAEGNASDPRETATRAENGEDPRPRLVPLNWDQRHTLNLTFTLSNPDRYTAAAIVRVVSGQPYTPEITTGFGGGLEANSGRKPNGMLIDVRGEHFLSTRRGVRMFARVFNLFDTRIYNGFVFADTGSPDYSRTPGANRAALADPLRFYSPRRVEVGLTASGFLGGGGAK
ncbi:MAG: TonB-dependent receptor [Candidatus Eisenbacteria bacterium]|uniref:TonB-dependent receptor n=1 Tax=Eiseniibacteriota bacterium TaxID=2212470 RepID=A0A849SLJ0_UNCEI|nr:TonB-dependent receptor [Candidatus Eisenbacteria bacterium]